ncbi:MAG: hypothetical protein NTU49_04890, partial [Gammaproteobacteria bacterium]|nr:hypothetical protein [Gammaproteobacteria bacterium]
PSSPPQKPIEKTSKSASVDIINQSVKSAVDEYRKKSHFGKSDKSNVLFIILSGDIKSDKMTDAISKSGALKDGKSALATTLAKHGLAEHIPELLINRVQAVVNEYRASEKSLSSIFRTHGEKSGVLVKALNDAVEITDPIKAAAAIKQAFSENPEIGGRLSNLLKENGLEKLADSCKQENKNISSHTV